jgi:FlaA1/EpsC-like NDP-sugar epimerase
MIDQLLSLSRRQKQGLMMGVDTVLVIVALCVAHSLRANRFYLPPEGNEIYLWVIAPIIALPVFIQFGLYQTVIRYIGFNSLWRVFQAISLYALLWGVCAFLSGFGLTPRSVVIINWLVALLFVAGARMIARWILTNRAPAFLGAERDGRKNVVIYGAGAAGMQLAIATSFSPEMRPVAFVDDDPILVNQQVNGVRVYHPDQLGRLIDEFAVKEVLLAMPSATQNRRQEILSGLEHYPVLVQTLPDISELERCEVNLEDVRDIDIGDLLERDPIAPIEELLHANIRGKVVMVTGAGGSIGAELCRQISQLGAARLVMFDHSEFNLYRIERELAEAGIEYESVLGSVRDQSAVEYVCRVNGVQTIYHAAAYKHVPLVEINAAMGVANNVLGTRNCAQAAINTGIETFVLISTDKAVRPTNIMGATKRLAELLLQDLSHNNNCSTRFTMVRFGNVLDSSGSVVPLFREQIKRGGPVTVTHPEIIRYFMTIREATQLVLQAGAMGQGGDVFVLDMGEPVKIIGLARKMIHLSGLRVKEESAPDGDIEINFTGLRRGEKLYEELLVTDTAVSTPHPRIMRESEICTNLGHLNPCLEKLERAIRVVDNEQIRVLLFDMVESYNPARTEKAS